MDDSGRVISLAIYNVLGIDKDGHKDVSGMYISKNEVAIFRLSVLSDHQNRGINDIQITSIDNLKGFAESISNVFHDAVVQLCVVYQIRNFCKYVDCKHQKEFLKDLKKVYQHILTTQRELDG